MVNLKVFLLVPVLSFIIFVSGAHAQMSSTNFKITSSVMSGGGNEMSSTSYLLVSTLGQSSPSENSSSVSYGLDSGFWYTLLLAIVGDVNGDGNVNLKDVIAALQVATGQSPADIYNETDADGDGRIGLGEAIMVLRKLGGLP